MKLYSIPVRLPAIGQVVFVSQDGFVTRERVTDIELRIDTQSPDPMEPDVWVGVENHIGATGIVPLREVHATHAEACARAFEREFVVTRPSELAGDADDQLTMGLEA